MLIIMKNNWARLMEEKAYLFVSILLTVCAVIAAVALINKVEIKGNLALVINNSDQKEAADLTSLNKYFNVTILDNVPVKSELLFHRYDAIVTFINGSYTIDTIKGGDYKELLSGALQNPSAFTPDLSKERKIGTNIIGYMMMFLLMQGVLYARLFAEDKEKHLLERIVTAPVAFSEYILGHGLFIMLLIVIPSFGIIAAASLAGVTVGFTLLQYALLIGLLAFLSTAFALFLNSLLCSADTVNMAGSSVIVLTSILAGSFYSFTKADSVFYKILYILPQKDFINVADAIEKKKITGATELQYIYIGALSLLFLAAACIKTRNDYVYHK